MTDCYIVTYYNPISVLEPPPPVARVVMSKLAALDAVREWCGNFTEQGKRVAVQFLENEGWTWVWFSTTTPTGTEDPQVAEKVLLGKVCFVQRGTL